MEAQERSIVDLESGDPDIGTPKATVEAAKWSLDAGETHYGSGWGLTEFIETIQQITQRSRDFSRSYEYRLSHSFLSFLLLHPFAVSSGLGFTGGDPKLKC